MIDILAHLVSENQRYHRPDGPFTHRNAQIISDYITQTARVLSLEMSGISHVAESWKEKGSSLIQGLHNIIAQRNQSINLDVAKANWWDTAAVTTMNLIAVIFLPATYFAALFQTSFFVNLIDGLAAYQQVMIYAAVSITVTASIIATWLVWTRRVRRRR
ncbi:hypothetical protein B0J13DRAFT_271652 [Dactylonectria estremocensis]|uniref:Uncharacterized protein n=1 Tax=Dactylonectria estremocensis TaxID=1079267 RepID=A0A9P9D380_9HYPO|nr:hypothetical protein B0J13DRAFT_271652 [Dactylonectria estremocensis]